MAVKCTECGAALQDDSKFCRYCGAKIIQENVQQINVKIDDSAELRRVAFLEKESEIRVKKMRREMRAKRLKWQISGGLLLIGLLMFLPQLLTDPHGKGTTVSSIGIVIALLSLGFIIIEWLNKK